MTNAPFLSIVIPTRNRCDLLRRAIDSVLADASQEFELVVSDNCSSDSTSELQRHYPDPRIRWYRQDANLGMVGNWNFCIGAARGERALLLSDDDHVAPGFASAIVARRAELQKASLAFTSCVVESGTESSRPYGPVRRAPYEEHDFLLDVLRRRIHVQLCAAIFERSFLVEHPFRSDMVYAMDMEAWVSQVDHRGVCFVPEATAFYSVHVANASSSIQLERRFAEDAAITSLLLHRLRGTQPGLLLRIAAVRRNLLQARYLAGTAGVSGVRQWLAAASLALSSAPPG